MGIDPEAVRAQLALFGKPGALRQHAYTILDRVQKCPPDIQILATAVALVAMADGVGADPHGLITTIRRAEAHINAPFTHQFEAIKAYARGELLSG